MTVELASLQEGDSFTGALVRLEDLNLYNRCYSYRLMAAEPGPPNVVQEFILEPTHHGRMGIKSRFGKYQRSEHWNRVVSQSPHCKRDKKKRRMMI
jgi:hypothetical protein